MNAPWTCFTEPPTAILAADAGDPLRAFRDRFHLPQGVVYLDGNSLGALPTATPSRLQAVVEVEWGHDLIGSWNGHDWFNAPRRIGDKIAGVIGAGPGEVMVADSTSVNLFKALAAALQARPGRSVILSEPGNFPTDLYVAQGVARLLPDRRVMTVPVDELAAEIDADTAVVMLTHVHYKTGRRLDMARLTAAAHAKGALVIWDLSHSVGAIEVDLSGCGADAAVGCGYKYLNGGPGAPAFIYVPRRLQSELHSPLSGWMGHAEPFAFDDDYRPHGGIERFACGTPAILGLAALEQGVDLVLEAGIAAAAIKAERLTDGFIAGVEARCAGYDLVLATPRDFAERGSHVSFRHPHAYEVCRALIDRGVVGDFRAPDILRFGFTPLYTSFADVWRAVEVLSDVLATRSWDQDTYRVRTAVT